MDPRKMVNKSYLIILFLIGIKLSIAQKSLIGIGFSAGYKSTYQEQGAYVYSRLLNKFDIHLGYSILGNFNGKGIGSGFRYVPFDKKLQPFIGLGYSYNFGKNINLKRDTIESQYKNPRNSFLLYETGLMFKYVQNNPTTNINATFLIIASLTYRTKLTSINPTLIGGAYDSTLENNLQKRVGNGFGASLSIVIIGNKKTNL